MYLAEIAIPRFRQNKMATYAFTMQDFSFDEMKNAERHLQCWKEFQKLTVRFVDLIGKEKPPRY